LSEAETPERSSPRHEVTLEDIRQLSGASTPHFALQLRNRILNLIAPLPPDHPARVAGLAEIRRLEALGYDGETRGEAAQDGQRTMPSVARQTPA
jgi:hypothetical protein